MPVCCPLLFKVIVGFCKNRKLSVKLEKLVLVFILTVFIVRIMQEKRQRRSKTWRKIDEILTRTQNFDAQSKIETKTIKWRLLKFDVFQVHEKRKLPFLMFSSFISRWKTNVVVMKAWKEKKQWMNERTLYKSLRHNKATGYKVTNLEIFWDNKI